MAKLLKATISGSFVAGDKEVESYSNVTGYLPALDQDKAEQMIRKRFAIIWISQATKPDGETLLYKRVGRVRETFVDSIEDEDGKQLSYVGKSIMDMNYEELQDLAAAKDLSAIPLYKTGSLTQARRVAFAEYSTKVLGEPLNWRADGFNPAKYPTIIADASIRRADEHVADIEETLDREALVLKGAAKESSMPSRLTLEQLKEIALSKKIAFNVNIGYEALYRKIYKENAAA